jgi:hypothetical protein
MTAQSQPDAMPFLQFTLGGVSCRELGPGLILGSTNVITRGNNFELKTELSFDGALVPILVGPPGAPFYVTHHVENIETGDTLNLPVLPPSPSFTVGVGIAAIPAHITVTSGPYTTGATGSGAHLEIPAGYAAGSFRITTHVHAVAAGIRPIVTAINDGLLIEIV